MSKTVVMIIILGFLLAGVGWFIWKITGNNSPVINSVAESSREVSKQTDQPAGTPTNNPTFKPAPVRDPNDLSDLRQELDSINPQILDTDFNQ